MCPTQPADTQQEADSTAATNKTGDLARFSNGTDPRAYKPPTTTSRAKNTRGADRGGQGAEVAADLH
eukprot:9469885-Pyramimonas_sp.AAC.1